MPKTLQPYSSMEDFAEAINDLNRRIYVIADDVDDTANDTDHQKGYTDRDFDYYLVRAYQALDSLLQSKNEGMRLEVASKIVENLRPVEPRCTK